MEFWVTPVRVDQLEETLEEVAADLLLERWALAFEKARDVAESVHASRAVEKRAWLLASHAAARLGHAELARSAYEGACTVDMRSTTSQWITNYVPWADVDLEHWWELLRHHPRLYDPALERVDDPARLVDQAMLFALFGREQEAATVCERLLEMSKAPERHRRAGGLLRAHLHARAGERAEAVELLDRDMAFEARVGWLGYLHEQLRQRVDGLS